MKMSITKCEPEMNPFAAGATRSKKRIRHCTSYALVIFVASGLGAFAATQTEKEFYDLRAQRDKAVAQAMKPINDRYQASLDALVKRATQAGDLDTALMIRKEIESLGELAADSGSKSIEKPSDFRDTTWEWHYLMGDKDQMRGPFTLENGGKVKVPSSLGFITGWEPVSDRKFKILNKNGKFWLFDYNSTTKEAHSILAKGAIQEDDKTMKLVPAHK